MIDTDKYEGHTPSPWTVRGSGFKTESVIATPKILVGKNSDTKMKVAAVSLDGLKCRREHQMNVKLIADAPLLLAEVKQAREIVPKLSRLIGVEIPWIQDDYPMLNDIFVGKTIEWNYDDSGEWVLVNHNESRWVTMSYIEAYNVSEYREQVGLKEVKE